jgi:hypothetical protein
MTTRRTRWIVGALAVALVLSMPGWATTDSGR